MCNHCNSRDKHIHNVNSSLKVLLIKHCQKIVDTSFENVDYKTTKPAASTNSTTMNRKSSDLVNFMKH